MISRQKRRKRLEKRMHGAVNSVLFLNNITGRKFTLKIIKNICLKLIFNYKITNANGKVSYKK
jgi:hypothetical protein